ncbi:MAG: hypothetical protein K2H46_02665 [Muribaculaceae bacterium]|nr:hypothetical protein [Muribaculaceae bacterium]
MEPITIEREGENGLYIVRQGDKYADEMCWDEMLGLVVSLTMPEDFSRMGWMMTEEQHRQAYPWRFRDKEEKTKETLLLTMK